MSCACVTTRGHRARRAPARRAARTRAARRACSRRRPAARALGRRQRARRRPRCRRRAARAGRKFMPGEPMKWPTKVCCGRSNSSGGAADLHRAAARHHHHLLGEGQRLDLVVRDVDQRELELVVDLLELAAQLPLQVRVDHGQRLVEQHRRHVRRAPGRGPARSSAWRRPPGRRRAGSAGRSAPASRRSRRRACLICGSRHAAVAQREGQVLGHRHRVVDHRELEHLRDVALLRRRRASRRGRRTARVPCDGVHQARDDVEQRGLAAARGAEQRVGAAVLEAHLQRQQRVVARRAAGSAV